jgi:hypothetical protein
MTRPFLKILSWNYSSSAEGVKDFVSLASPISPVVKSTAEEFGQCYEMHNCLVTCSIDVRIKHNFLLDFQSHE